MGEIQLQHVLILVRALSRSAIQNYNYPSRGLALCLFSDSIYLLNGVDTAVIFRKGLLVSIHFRLVSLADHRGLPVMTRPQKYALPSCNTLSFKKPLLAIEPDLAVLPAERQADFSWYQAWSQPAQATA